MSIYVQSATPDRNSNNLFSQYLTNGERRSARQLSLTSRTDWLAGRVSAKRAVGDLHNEKLDPRDLYVTYGNLGQPQIASKKPKDIDSETHVSISHRSGIGVSSAAFFPVGIDVEVAQERDPQMLSYISSLNESQIAESEFADPNHQITFLWVIKEAVMKADGCGLSLPPNKVVIRSVVSYNSEYKVQVSAPLPTSRWSVCAKKCHPNIFIALARPRHDRNKNIIWNLRV